MYQKGWEKVQETGLGFCFKGVEVCRRIEGILRHMNGFLGRWGIQKEGNFFAFTVKSGPRSKSLH